jgi:protein-S-isoprenylcysteine O-methyltransferase Ste14
MNKTLEDNLGKLAMLLIFGYVAFAQAKSLFSMVMQGDAIALWQLAFVSHVFGFIFISYVLYFTITRLPPRESADGIMPRITAVTGTFAMMGLIMLPPENVSAGMRVVSTVLVIVGTFMSIYCLRQLGRSFSIMATARELVTEGPYKFVRHPLYAAELITIVGVVLGHGSPLAFAVGAIWLLLQIRRAMYEESILRQSFPEYESYARRVPMMVPGLTLSRAGSA